MLGECIAGKGMRIHTHNDAVLKITGEATDKGFSVTRKKSFVVGEQTL